MSVAQTSRPRKHADEIAEWLVELGFTHCFFVAGGNIMHLLDAVRTRMTCIPVVHEVSAGIAAEYFNEVEGEKRAFALVTAGPGVTNIITAMSGAWLESRQLLVLAGQVKSPDLSRGQVRQKGIQEIDGVALTKPVSKDSVCVERPISKKEFVNCVRSSWEGRPGPVFLEFCLDAQGAAPIDDHVEILGLEQPQSLTTRVEEAAAYIIHELERSQRPVILLGGGISRKTMQVVRDLERFDQFPMMTTWNGADRLDAGDRNYLGRPNTWGQRAANLLLAQSDCIVALGTRLGLQQTGFNWQEFGSSARVIQVDIDQRELEKGHPRVDKGFCCDANEILVRVVQGATRQFAEWLRYGQRVRELLPLNDPSNSTSEGFVCPYEFFLEISELAQTDDMLIPCSSGGANSVAMQTICQKFGQYVVTNKGLASMGYGLAGAIGASLARPDKRSLLFEGDGGFAQNLQELATVCVNRLKMEIFIFANNGYGSIRTTQRNYFDGAYLGCDEMTGLGFPDWEGLFASYRIPCTRLDETWKKTLRSTLHETDGPRAWIVPIDPNQTYWPKITSRVTQSGGMESRPLHDMSPDLDPALLSQVTQFLEVG